MFKRNFELFLVATFLYFSHNFTNFLFYGFDPILVITFVPFIVVGTVWGLWRKLHPYVIAPILVFLAVVEIPVLMDNFFGFQLQTISGIFQLGSMILLGLNAFFLIKNKQQYVQKPLMEEKSNG